ncbi:cytochrome bd-I oxidase subunit CydX [Escherichia albertii]|nr:cytochrome bd-I oxidase subunit CydX [Escherichia albertii]EEU9599287.1 cytochrome bd-I oxidase subunit CydX [Escherichia albertii]EEW4359854.1 cytochrome bd-I oxidase subunit CydX [Escherichia albertii]EEW6711849.1 cytochrome bd-I oxidase subunit CydX [Escherichia albertii]EEW7553020.1 cytochrome bd-I oxidase subunit CydX [Escherichia albertii]EEX4923848.1 cytochrome bd-I oxidase subunit CydX [Escherichia albertii]
MWYLSWVLGTLLACTLAIIITICYDN